MLRFDPFSDYDALARYLHNADRSAGGRSPQFMPMDLCKVDDHYLLITDLPGADPESIDVSVDNGMLTISAERTARTEEGAQWLAAERFSGSYRRQISLGDGIDASRISAQYDDGVLTVTIPVAEVAKPRKISVERSGQAREISASAPA